MIEEILVLWDHKDGKEAMVIQELMAQEVHKVLLVHKDGKDRQVQL